MFGLFVLSKVSCAESIFSKLTILLSAPNAVNLGNKTILEYIKLNIKKNKINNLQLFLFKRNVKVTIKAIMRNKDISDEICHIRVSGNKLLNTDFKRLY